VQGGGPAGAAVRITTRPLGRESRSAARAAGISRSRTPVPAAAPALIVDNGLGRCGNRDSDVDRRGRGQWRSAAPVWVPRATLDWPAGRHPQPPPGRHPARHSANVATHPGPDGHPLRPGTHRSVGVHHLHTVMMTVTSIEE